MTAAPGETSRVPGREPAAWARDLRPLLILLAAALLWRLLLAYVLLPGSGFRTDIGTFASWALTLAQHGPGQFYEAAGFADYPPGYLYVLWLVGELATLLASVTGLAAGAVASGLIKLPPMIADVAVGLVLYLLVRSWAGARADAQRLGLLAAGLYLFMPVTWYDSAIWGQTDAFGALLTLLAVAALVRGNSEGASALAVLAALVKPQFGVVLLPLVGIFLLRRHLLRPGSGPRNRALVPAGLRDWFEQERGAWRLLSSAVVGLLVLMLLLLPFSLDLPGFVRRMAETAGGYAYLTVNAYNPWALVGADGRPPFAFGGGWSADTVPLLGPIPGVLIGAALLAAGFGVGLLRALWRDDRRSIVLVAIVLSLCFFVLPTRVHERYLFPVFALLPLLAVVDRRWLWATLVLVGASFINLHGVLTNPLYATPNLVGMPFGELFREPLLIVLSAALHAAVFAFVGWQLRRSAAAEPVVGAVETGPTPPLPPAPVAATGWSLWLADVRDGLTRLTAVVPLRRDRSALLVGEGGGPIQRIDLLLLLLVFIVALGLRTFRLDEPRSMYFDEVYHARTAIEFLQDWEYDMPHSIYEYTHPHLAKYLMALGIMTLGNNRVTDTRQLDGPVLGAALEQRWSPSETPALRNGDWLYVLTPAGVDAYDLASRQKVASVPLAGRALAVDESEHALYVGDAAGGVWRMATADFDALRHAGSDQRPPTPAGYAQIDGLDGELAWLAVDRGQLLVASSGGTLVSVEVATASETGRAVAPGAVNAAFASVDGGDAVVVGGPDGVTILEAATLARLHQVATEAPVAGLALVTDGVEDPTVYAAVGNSLHRVQLPSDEEPRLGPTVAMPGEVSAVHWNRATTLIHAVGSSPDGQPTVYVAEPRSNAVFADARLAGRPLAVVLDVQPQRPAEDRLDLLAIDAAGAMHSVDIGNNAFAWRLPGVIAGALMAAALYLLARFLFARRSVAVLVGLLALVEGMFFSNARIGMNDTYVAFFIVAALTVFAPLWLGRWRGRFSLPLGLLAVGLLLGLALASKWVALYAIGAVGLLILLRSAFGRLLALLALIGLTAILGYLAITPAASVESPQFNYLFLLLMVGLTLALAAGMTLRPMRMSADEVRFAVFGPGLVGLGLLLAGGAWLALGPAIAADALLSPNRLIVGGTALLLVACGLYVGLRLAASRGLGPLAPAGPPPPGIERATPPPPRGWLRPGSGRLGLPWIGAMLAITVVPLLVYIVSYVPWVALGNQWLAGLPEGHAGQTFLDLQRSMYDYHNYLRATHPASSPWWAWPFDFKPVWFEQEGYANSTTAVIYNTGNLVVFWLAIPAVAWAAYQAWRRRSLALGFLLIAICCLWLPWARVDRVAFQYHVLTTLPFSVLALAYFLAELWHGPAARTWLLARVAAAAAIVGPALLWLVRLPLCGLARVETVNANAEVCGVLNRQLVITDIQLAGMGLIALALGGLGAMLWLGADAPRWWRDNRHWLTPLGLTVLLGGMSLLLAGAVVPATTVFEAPLRLPELPALLALVLLAVPAYFVLRARDARRYVVGALVAAGVWFVAWYPNVAGLPVPSRIAQVYLGFLPTWNYSFQFGNNQDEAFRGGPDWISVALLGAVLGLLVVALVYYLRWWLSDRAERRSASVLEAQREAG